MKNMFLKGMLLSPVLSFMFGCNSAPAPIDKEQVKKDIQAKEDEFAATYNAGKLKDIGYYADDATSFYQNRPPLVGKPAIIAFLVSDLAQNSNKISFKTNEVFVSADGDQVLELGSFKVVDSVNTAVNTGNYMSLFVKKEGKYTCLRDMSASDTPLQ